MILSICSDKRSPGVTMAATALAVMWPGERVVLEADPSGGDLLLRLRTPQGGRLAINHSVTSLAADAREGIPPDALLRYAQPTSLGFPVLVSPTSAEGFEPMSRLWPQIAAAAQVWSGTVIADLGRLQLRHASSPLAAASTTVLLLTRADTSEDLEHVRQRAHELAARVGQGGHGRSPLAVAVVAPARSASGAVNQVQQVLAAQATTSTIPVLGYLADDRRGVEGLRNSDLSKRVLGSDLFRSAKSLVAALTGWFPEVIGMPAPPVMPASMPATQHQAAQWGTPSAPIVGGAGQ